MVLSKLLNKSSRKHRLDANQNPDSKKSPQSPQSSPEKPRTSNDREKPPNLSPTKSSNRSSRRFDKDSHPLNLPPELRRLSALSAMSTTSSEQNHDGTMEQTRASSPTTQSSTPTTPSNSYINSPFQPDDRPPVPPHRVPTSPPPQSPSSKPNMAQANAEACKVAGNNFFKSQNYPKAIEEYSKGICVFKHNDLRVTFLTSYSD
jgi:DnaJ family protein C protein 7